MSTDEKDLKKKEEKPTTDTTGQPATPTTAPETPTTKAEIKVTHEFISKPADIPPVEKPAETPKPVETPKVETPTEKELRETKEKLEERETQLGLIATKAFDEDKTAFLSQIKDETKRASAEKMIGDDPDKLESAKMMAQLIIAGIEQAGGHVKDKPIEKPAETPKTPEIKPEGDGTEPIPNVGKAKAAPVVPTGGDAKQIAKEVIDTCFAILADPNKSQAEKDAANQKVNEMYAEFRRGAKEGRKTDDYQLIPVMECPKCRKTMEGNTCQSCGYVIPKWQSGPVFGK